MIYTLAIGIFRRVSTLSPGLNFGLKTQSNVASITQSTLRTLTTITLLVCLLAIVLLN